MQQYLDAGGGGEQGVVGVLQAVLFGAPRLRAHQQAEVRPQVAAEEGLTGRDVEQQGQRLHVEPRLQHLPQDRASDHQNTHTLRSSSLI